MGGGGGSISASWGGVLGRVGVLEVSVFIWSGRLFVLGGAGVAGGVFVKSAVIWSPGTGEVCLARFVLLFCSVGWEVWEFPLSLFPRFSGN